jgi:HD-GYP domain-containing protein (c-di-GMP phosphodiesterase class II)
VLVLEPTGDWEPIVDAAAAALSEDGEGFAVGSSFGTVLLPAEAELPAEALRIADQRLYAHKHSRRAGRGGPHEVLLRALHDREPDLHAHVSDVVRLAVGVGRRLGLAATELEELRLAAELHDIGRLAVPDAILGKPGPLDESEWALIRQHTLVGERILGAVPGLSRVGKIVRHTHERWNGTGYPDGLSGNAVPLAARVIAVCEAYAAMTSGRPYRAAVTSDEAVAELRRCAGTQFDASLVDVFCWALAAGELDRPVEPAATAESDQTLLV